MSQAFFAGCAVGDRFDGNVVAVVSFGAFVELPAGVHGLLHKDEWAAGAPAPSVGSPVRVEVLAIDAARQRLSLRPA